MKKGFTLIELLAVIVILAIIALIAVPIVLNIINNSKESASLRSAELYVKAVEYAIANKILEEGSIENNRYEIMSNGSICLGTYVSSAKTCNGKDINDKENESVLRVEVSGEYPKEGYVVIEKGQVVKELSNDTTKKTELIISGKPIVKNDNNEFVLVENKETEMESGKFDSVCKIASDSQVTGINAGAKYLCKVDPNKESYTFYVLNSTTTEVNLIMDQNINSDGTPAGMTGITKDGDNIYNLVAWISDLTYECSDDYCALNDKGPVDAIQFLYTATKDWTNIEPLTYEYKDKESQGVTHIGYTSFIADKGLLTITALDGTPIVKIGTSEVPLRARIPIYSSDESITEVANYADYNTYLYDNLDLTGDGDPEGYWLLSSSINEYSRAMRVDYDGVGDTDVYYDSGHGVRPVINLKL